MHATVAREPPLQRRKKIFCSAALERGAVSDKLWESKNLVNENRG